LINEACSSISHLVRSAFAGFRFPVEVIVVAVGWYLRYGLSYRDVEELLAERGIEVDHVTVYRWVQRFTPLLADAARFARHSPGDRWFVDETYVKVNGVWRYVHRRSTSTARSLTCCSRLAVTPQPLVGSSPRRYER
jgi:transposase-like protein